MTTTHSRRMKSIVGLPGLAEPSVLELPLPLPSAHQATIKMIASGICHSQLNQIDALAGADANATGRLLGHEALAIVTDIGSDVTAVAPGDTVIVSWLPRSDVLGDRSIETSSVTLEDGQMLATPDIFTWSDYALADEAYLYPTNTQDINVSVLGCAVMTGAGAVRNSAEVSEGDTVAVIGAGGVGGSAIVAARAAGAKEIIAIDLSDEKLMLARKLGATKTINVSRETLTEVFETWKTSEGVSGVDHVIDCVASPRTFSDAITMVRRGRIGFGRGGNVIVVGVALRPAEADLRFIQMNGITIKGCFGGDSDGARDFPVYSEWFASEEAGLAELVTHSYAFEDILPALKELRSGVVTGRAVLTF